MPTLACALDRLDGTSFVTTDEFPTPSADERCFFCWRDFGPETTDTTCQPVALLPCRHLMGRECLDDFRRAENDGLCPICRSPIAQNSDADDTFGIKRVLAWICGTPWYTIHEWLILFAGSVTGQHWDKLHDGSISAKEAFQVWALQIAVISGYYLLVMFDMYFTVVSPLKPLPLMALGEYPGPFIYLGEAFIHVWTLSMSLLTVRMIEKHGLLPLPPNLPRGVNYEMIFCIWTPIMIRMHSPGLPWQIAFGAVVAVVGVDLLAFATVVTMLVGYGATKRIFQGRV